MKNSHIKKNKGLEVETMHGLETLDTLWSWGVFSSENLLKIEIKAINVKLCPCEVQVSVFCNALF